MSDTTKPESLRAVAAALRKELSTKGALTPKDRRAIAQQDMPSQDASVRRHNMNEVALGYFEDQAVVESLRCLGCANKPCVSGCPVSIDIPSFLAKTAEGKFDEAYATIRESSMLPAICGRVCPQEKQCMAMCTVGKAEKNPEKSVAIGRVERFLADRGRAQGTKAAHGAPRPKASGFRVAIVGSGPSGLTAAADLARLGHDVTIYEAFHKPGGVAVYGIPEFRLPKAIVEEEARSLESLGVKIVCDFLVGRTRTVHDLLEKDGFNAVYIATGAGLPKFMGIPGEDLVGVFSANEYLTRSNLMKAYDRDNAATPLYSAKRVAVFGGGNVAMDAARTALRAGADEVRVVYRRTEAEMPARVEEVHHAMEEGVIFDYLANPTAIIGDEKGRVKAAVCQRYKLGEPDASGRAKPIAIPGSEFTLEIDACIVALGNDSNPLVTGTTPELNTTPRGNIIVDEHGATSMSGVFAGGDIVQGAATVILAMGDGRRAAAGIDDYLKGKKR
jgi:glutamate synthase (NADPH/NADH) small chain